MGKNRFLWRAGVLKRGLPIGVVVTFGPLILRGEMVGLGTRDIIGDLIGMLAGSLTFGLAYGLLLWKQNERRFQNMAVSQ
jgi:hypothetical protein